VPQTAPTPEAYGSFQQAFDWFNKTLFDNEPVPPLLVTLVRGKSFRGYFSRRRFSRIDGEIVHELAMNPDCFVDDRDILSTFVHELVHAWQEHYGKPGRGKYHNRGFANRMKEIGLFPSSTGQPGGEETGDRISHYIIEGGKFDLAFQEFQGKGFKILWGPVKKSESPHIVASLPSPSSDPAAPEEYETGGRVKYECKCGNHVWGKAGLEIQCKVCNHDFHRADAKWRKKPYLD
jgi:hypothetical protein